MADPTPTQPTPPADLVREALTRVLLAQRELGDAALRLMAVLGQPAPAAATAAAPAGATDPLTARIAAAAEARAAVRATARPTFPNRRDPLDDFVQAMARQNETSAANETTNTQSDVQTNTQHPTATVPAAPSAADRPLAG